MSLRFPRTGRGLGPGGRGRLLGLRFFRALKALATRVTVATPPKRRRRRCTSARAAAGMSERTWVSSGTWNLSGLLYTPIIWLAKRVIFVAVSSHSVGQILIVPTPCFPSHCIASCLLSAVDVQLSPFVCLLLPLLTLAIKTVLKPSARD